MPLLCCTLARPRSKFYKCMNVKKILHTSTLKWYGAGRLNKIKSWTHFNKIASEERPPNSFFSSLVVRITVDPESVPGMLGVSQEYTLELSICLFSDTGNTLTWTSQEGVKLHQQTVIWAQDRTRNNIQIPNWWWLNTTQIPPSKVLFQKSYRKLVDAVIPLWTLGNMDLGCYFIKLCHFFPEGVWRFRQKKKK